MCVGPECLAKVGTLLAVSVVPDDAVLEDTKRLRSPLPEDRVVEEVYEEGMTEGGARCPVESEEMRISGS